jgi:hypothetical protein
MRSDDLFDIAPAGAARTGIPEPLSRAEAAEAKRRKRRSQLALEMQRRSAASEKQMRAECAAIRNRAHLVGRWLLARVSAR